MRHAILFLLILSANAWAVNPQADEKNDISTCKVALKGSNKVFRWDLAESPPPKSLTQKVWSITPDYLAMKENPVSVDGKRVILVDHLKEDNFVVLDLDELGIADPQNLLYSSSIFEIKEKPDAPSEKIALVILLNKQNGAIWIYNMKTKKRVFHAQNLSSYLSLTEDTTFRDTSAQVETFGWDSVESVRPKFFDEELESLEVIFRPTRTLRNMTNAHLDLDHQLLWNGPTSTDTFLLTGPSLYLTIRAVFRMKLIEYPQRPPYEHDGDKAYDPTSNLRGVIKEIALDAKIFEFPIDKGN